jgi:GntP family gluconate:H+ symporter
MTNTYYLFFLLLVSIVFIIWITAYKKVNAFFGLLLAALGVGLLSGMPIENIAGILKAGFGHTMEKIGLLILFGTTLGVILEKTGATLSMANAILRIVKEKNAPAAISLTGFIIGLPIFCDSGFIILSGLNHSLVKKTPHRMPVMAAALATSLYAVHCLVPPHPGITAAVGTAGGDLGMVMLWGIVLAIPAALVGYAWSVWRGKKITHAYIEPETTEAPVIQLPSAALSFLPVALPIILIAAKSVLLLFSTPEAILQSPVLRLLSFAGEPVIALAIAILVSFTLIHKAHKKELSHWLTAGVEKAGMILAIIAAGGMFGEMLQATGMGKNLGTLLSGLSLGIFFPFIITAILKTAQGSSTVAIITAASLITPLLPDLGLQSSTGLTLAILSMGAGSMVVSHANDAYFWVISRFSNMETAATLKAYSVATLLMGVTVLLLIWIAIMVMPAMGQQRQSSLKMKVLFSPASVMIGGKPTVYYELLLTSHANDSLRLRKLNIRNSAGMIVKEVSPRDLIGLSSMSGNILAPGAKAVIYLEVALADNKAGAFTNELEFEPIHNQSAKRASIQSVISNFSGEDPIVVGAPLRGGEWGAVYDPAWTRGHRRVIYSTDGDSSIPGRFAIDFIQLDSNGYYAKGKEDEIKNWYGYGVDVLAVADGVVAAALDTFTESTTLSAHPDYPPTMATGNYISLDLGNDHLAFYEHLKPGSIKVKAGQRVKKGDIIASLVSPDKLPAHTCTFTLPIRILPWAQKVFLMRLNVLSPSVYIPTLANLVKRAGSLYNKILLQQSGLLRIQ